MNPNEDNFDDLQKLLALKRHEQPPPGYFENFSSKVIARIEAAEMERSVSFWQRLWRSIEARPATISGYALGASALVVLALSLAPSGNQQTAGRQGHQSAAFVAATQKLPTPPHLVTPPHVSLQPVASAPENTSLADSALNPDAAPAEFFNVNGVFRSLPAGRVPQRASLNLSLEPR